MPKILRDYQNDAIAALRQSIAGGHRRPILCAPTGSGKTAMAAAIVNYAMEKGNRAIFTVPAIELVDQTVEAFWHDGIRDVGVIQADHHMTRPDAAVQVASVQTLMRRGVPNGFKIGIIDEAHRLFKLWDKWFPEANYPIVGLSATPGTKGLGKYFDDLVIACTTQELIDSGHLSPFRAFAHSHPDLSGVKTVAGDYHEGDLADASNKPELVADIVTTWLNHGDNQPTLLFAVDRAHAKALQAQFEASGVKTGYVDCFTKDYERKAIKSSFHRGDIKVVCNVGVLTTGVDWDVRCIILARPTKSKMLYVQIVGRGLRTAPRYNALLAFFVIIILTLG